MDPDDDNDGMSDEYEIANGLDPLVDDASGDPDHDGLTNLEEFLLGTAANDTDTDNDGVSDGDEVDAGTDPLDGEDHAYIPRSGFNRGWRLAIPGLISDQ